MPIDFNPYSSFNVNPTNYTQKITSQQNIIANQPIKDTFTKSVKVGADVNSEYDGIKIEQKQFGTIKKTGEKATLYTITNKNGASVDLSTFGATITSIKVPDKDGNIKDVTQGYDNVTPYEESPVGHAGGTIGPYANKIQDGKFTLNGKEYKLECNKEFTYEKEDMENGYPAKVQTTVTYKFDNNNNLHIKYKAKSNKDTIMNLTNHTYFNLDGVENTQENSVYEHVVTLPNSSTYTENSDIAVPTGEIKSVEGTPFDFRKPKKISDDIEKDFEQLKIGSGFDQNFCIDNYDGKTMIEAASVKSPKTGIVLKVSTNLPGFQFYSANHLGKSAQPEGKSGSRYEKRSSFCVEPQFYPNAINTESFKEKGILKKGEEYDREIIYSFSTEK